MKKNIFICNTSYQLIVALQLLITKFSYEHNTLLLSDAIPQAEILVRRLNECDIRVDAYYIRTRKSSYENYFSYLSGKIKLVCPFLNSFKNFDRMFFYNIDVISTSIYYMNPNISCFRFEEGILSYNNFNKTIKKTIGVKILDFFYKTLNKTLLEDIPPVFFCFFPELCMYECKVEKIPLIKKDSELIKILKRVYSDFDIKQYDKYKYIFLSSVCDFEGGESIGEFSLVEKIVKKIGSDNILVKLHPRDTRHHADLHIDKNSKIPWEVMLLISNFDDKIIMTTTSNSLISANLIFESSGKNVFLYRLCNISQNDLACNAVNQIEYVLHKIKNNRIIIADSFDDFM